MSTGNDVHVAAGTPVTIQTSFPTKLNFTLDSVSVSMDLTTEACILVVGAIALGLLVLVGLYDIAAAIRDLAEAFKAGCTP